jgi:poly(ADP-ribose) glycohydrolase
MNSIEYVETLPNMSERTLNNIFKLFNNQFKNIKDINKIFFENNCYFFDKISKKYSKEGEEFIKVFNELKKLVFDINTLFPYKAMETLKTGENKMIKLNRKKVALLFLLSFLNLIYIRPNNKKNCFIVSRLLFKEQESAFQFGRCFLNYLTVIGKWLSEKDPILSEEVIYLRTNNNSQQYLYSQENDIKLCKINLKEKGSLFNSNASYCVDFANKYIGGGVLNGGCVQEEILFAIEPEAVVSLFFMEVMGDNDAIGIYNTIQYSKYTGYGFEFKYDGSFIDNVHIKRHRIIAIDAISKKRNNSHSYFQTSYDSLEKEIKRDIHKAYVGFSLAKLDNDIPKTIATGNWGCGAFNGNHELKFIQQWIAASFAGIEILDYYTFKDKNMILVEKYYEKINDKFKTAKELFNALLCVSSIDKNYIQNLLSIQNK